MHSITDKPIVEKIVLTEEQQQEVRDILDGKPTKVMIERWKGARKQMNMKSYRPGSIKGRKDIVKKYYFKGLCHICHDFATYKVLHDYDGAKLVEYYCEKHFDKLF
jgi:hypothetical protein